MLVLRLRCADHELALPLEAVTEVLPPAWIEPVEDAAPPLVGTLNWHGEILWAVDLDLWFGHPRHTLTRDSRLLVVTQGGSRLVLICPEVEDVAELESLAAAPAPHHERIRAVGRHGEVQVQVLNLDRLFGHLA
ncbi:chemotaxis protein CheW [Hahella sp. SMD15-11]|uniref:Chemotaxis protein CheW n=1 Tax=Thermohahella caldifontis TaxID=3142973 RepID=A0AB39UTW5_9GAMM